MLWKSPPRPRRPTLRVARPSLVPELPSATVPLFPSGPAQGKDMANLPFTKVRRTRPSHVAATWVHLLTGIMTPLSFQPHEPAVPSLASAGPTPTCKDAGVAASPFL